MTNYPTKHPEVITRSEEPLNVEPPLELLRQNFITPTELFYIRNQQELQLSLKEMRENFPKSSVTAALQCVGNRRQGLMEVTPIPGEEPWSAGAIGNAHWSGAPLKEVFTSGRD
jgi:sulfite oxidase